MLNHILHRLAQPSGRIHGDQHRARHARLAASARPFVDVRGQHRLNFAIEIEL